MGNLFSVLYLLLFLAAGCALARRVLPENGWERTFPLGCAFCVAMLAMLPAGIGLVIGFCLPAALAAAAVAAVAGIAAWHGVSKKSEPLRLKKGLSPSWNDLAHMVPLVLPAVLLTVYLLYTHVLWYNAADGAYYTGQSGYGDVAMHLAFIKSIAVQGKMPPAYPLLAGQNLFGYPFLCESVSSVFLLLGASLKFAYILPEIPAIISIFSFIWLLSREVLKRAGKACLAWTLFVLGGGFGFCYFFTDLESFVGIFTGYYTTPTNDIAHNIRWVNCIADLLVPQRATLMGWALAMPCLYLLYRFAFEDEHRLWLPLGLLAGCLPLMQTHSLLALVLISAVWLVSPVVQAVRGKNIKTLLPWLGYAAVAGALCLPQLFGVIFRQTGSGENFLRFVFNWCNNATGENYFWFYIKNLGIVYLVQIPAWLAAKRPLRRFYLGGLVIMAVSEFIVFQPNNYDNIKLLFFWFLCACILAADALWDWAAQISPASARRVLAAMVICVCTLSSVLSLGREVISGYQVFGAEDWTAGEYIDEHAPADAVFLTGMEHLNPVASLSGRTILCGSTLYVYYHGMDYYAQQDAVRTLYEQPNEELLAQWGIDYVYISSWERNDYAVDEAWYAERYTVWYQNNSCIIYRITAN